MGNLGVEKMVLGRQRRNGLSRLVERRERVLIADLWEGC